MSNSIAAAKRRRAGIQSNNQESFQTSTPTSNANSSQSANPKLSMQNFILMMDKRISALEQSIKANTEPNNIQLELETPEGKKTMKITEYMEEMDVKFNMLAEEITNMKELLLKLQSFTMDVNKSLINSTSLRDILSPEKHISNPTESNKLNGEKQDKQEKK